ncbi:MAG TPA: universal stress protein [Acidimicrobiales bacterium]
MSDTDAASAREQEVTSLPQRIVVGTDGSPTATLAVRRAATLAKLFGAELRVLSAHREASRGGLWAGATPPDQNWLATASAAAQQVAENAAGVARELGVNEVSPRSMSAEPADALLDEAEAWKADLIVVGSVGMRTRTRFVLGSVPNKVAHHAPCDVLIVDTSI